MNDLTWPDTGLYGRLNLRIPKNFTSEMLLNLKLFTYNVKQLYVQKMNFRSKAEAQMNNPD